MKRIYVLLGLSGLYGLNRFLVLPALAAASQNPPAGALPAAAVLYRVFSSYGADILAGAWILCFLNLVLTQSGRRPIRNTTMALLFVLACGVFWEFITPFYLSRSVADPFDVLAYLIGGWTYLLIEKRILFRG